MLGADRADGDEVERLHGLAHEAPGRLLRAGEHRRRREAEVEEEHERAPRRGVDRRQGAALAPLRGEVDRLEAGERPGVSRLPVPGPHVGPPLSEQVGVRRQVRRPAGEHRQVDDEVGDDGQHRDPDEPLRVPAEEDQPGDGADGEHDQGDHRRPLPHPVGPGPDPGRQLLAGFLPLDGHPGEGPLPVRVGAVDVVPPPLVDDPQAPQQRGQAPIPGEAQPVTGLPQHGERPAGAVVAPRARVPPHHVQDRLLGRLRLRVERGKKRACARVPGGWKGRRGPPDGNGAPSRRRWCACAAGGAPPGPLGGPGRRPRS